MTDQPDHIDASDMTSGMEPSSEMEANGGLGGLDLASIMSVAQDMSHQLVEAQQRAAATVMSASAGGGAVRIEVDGAWVVHKVTIDPQVVDANEVEMLEDLIKAAINDAASKVHELTTSSNPMAGFDLGNLGGLFGS